MVWALLLNLGLRGLEPFGLVITFRGNAGKEGSGQLPIGGWCAGFEGEPSLPEQIIPNY